jgi:hypothetical protein
MKMIRLLAAAAVAIGLSGCFTSDKPLLTDATSVAPYQKITFREKSSDEVTTLTRDGKTYVAATVDGMLIMRFMPLDQPGWYLAEANGGKLEHLYAVLRVDLTRKIADAFKAVAGADDAKPGLRACDGMICIDDVQAYIASAKAAVAAGADPDTTYVITVE